MSVASSPPAAPSGDQPAAEAGPDSRLGLHLPRAAAVTAAMLAPLTPPPEPSELRRLHAELGGQLAALAEPLTAAGPWRLDGRRLLLGLSGAAPGFAADRWPGPSARRCRRAIGLAAVQRCWRRQQPHPAAAVASVLADAVTDLAGAAPAPWWAPWYAGLTSGGRAEVQAQAVTWATALWSAVQWSTLPRATTVGGRGSWWSCPADRRIVLHGRSDMRTWVEGRPVLVSLCSGAAPDAHWRQQLAWPALVAAVGTSSTPLPGRVVGIWPASSTVRVLAVDSDLLAAAAAGAVTAAAAWLTASVVSPPAPPRPVRRRPPPSRRQPQAAQHQQAASESRRRRAQRREWDSNPREPQSQRFSRPSHSSALPSLRTAPG